MRSGHVFNMSTWRAPSSVLIQRFLYISLYKFLRKNASVLKILTVSTFTPCCRIDPFLLFFQAFEDEDLSELDPTLTNLDDGNTYDELNDDTFGSGALGNRLFDRSFSIAFRAIFPNYSLHLAVYVFAKQTRVKKICCSLPVQENLQQH